MGKNPAYQFYPADWDRDLRPHPLEIEGAWIRICNCLWWSESPGKDTKTLEQWSRVLAVGIDDCRRILGYLKDENIGTIYGDPLTGDSKVTIICRRMVRDEKIRKIRQKCGKLGGNPKLKNQSDKDTLEVLDNQISTTRVTKAATKSQPLHLQSSSSIYNKTYLLRDKFPRNDPNNGSLRAVLDSSRDVFEKAYPAVDLDQEVAKAEAWLVSNPKNKKKNLKRFLNNWFSRAQDKLNRYPKEDNW